MEQLLKKTTPKEAFSMYEETFSKDLLPGMLDDAFMDFTNCMSLLRTDKIDVIRKHASKTQCYNFLGILSVCYLFERQTVLYSMMNDHIAQLSLLRNRIIKAKKGLEKLNRFLDCDVYDSLSEAIAKHQCQYNTTRTNIHVIEAMISLVNVMKRK